MDIAAKDLLMKRLCTISHHKIYPPISPKSEAPLRKILLTTRLWNHVRRQQALLTIQDISDDWLLEQEQFDPFLIMTKEESVELTSSAGILEDSNSSDWSWLDDDKSLGGLGHEDSSSANDNCLTVSDAFSLLSHTPLDEEPTVDESSYARKRPAAEIAAPSHIDNIKRTKKEPDLSSASFLHFVDNSSPSSPAGPASSPTSVSSTASTNSPVLLSV
ncbi:hypothetical protein EC973_003297 [Apophysomyces ossiformis]|uniref:Uncharacterized protein n=1 Tax=Apophysomyces ossiformis TaxID=679940 RepID=A0A8H7BZP5_9FUNG|nr:hypothetical protein EC973_003297 [Apophysomyces ossiformis]